MGLLRKQHRVPVPSLVQLNSWDVTYDSRDPARRRKRRVLLRGLFARPGRKQPKARESAAQHVSSVTTPRQRSRSASRSASPALRSPATVGDRWVHTRATHLINAREMLANEIFEFAASLRVAAAEAAELRRRAELESKARLPPGLPFIYDLDELAGEDTLRARASSWSGGEAEGSEAAGSEARLGGQAKHEEESELPTSPLSALAPRVQASDPIFSRLERLPFEPSTGAARRFLAGASSRWRLGEGKLAHAARDLLDAERAATLSLSAADLPRTGGQAKPPLQRDDAPGSEPSSGSMAVTSIRHRQHVNQEQGHQDPCQSQSRLLLLRPALLALRQMPDRRPPRRLSVNEI